MTASEAKNILRKHYPNIRVCTGRGSMRGTLSVYNKGKNWTEADANLFNSLGFKNFTGRPLDIFCGNGGYFSVAVMA